MGFSIIIAKIVRILLDGKADAAPLATRGNHDRLSTELFDAQTTRKIPDLDFLVE
jgi:hypothetical protein